jgi:hypothetical protein
VAFHQNIDGALARHSHRSFGRVPGGGNKLGSCEQFREAEGLCAGANPQLVADQHGQRNPSAQGACRGREGDFIVGQNNRYALGSGIAGPFPQIREGANALRHLNTTWFHVYPSCRTRNNFQNCLSGIKNVHLGIHWENSQFVQAREVPCFSCHSSSELPGAEDALNMRLNCVQKLMDHRGVAFKSTRPPESGNPARDSTGYSDSGSAVDEQFGTMRVFWQTLDSLSFVGKFLTESKL